jgi:hypothetical protein
MNDKIFVFIYCGKILYKIDCFIYKNCFYIDWEEYALEVNQELMLGRFSQFTLTRFFGHSGNKHHERSI